MDVDSPSVDRRNFVEKLEMMTTVWRTVYDDVSTCPVKEKEPFRA